MEYTWVGGIGRQQTAEPSVGVHDSRVSATPVVVAYWCATMDYEGKHAMETPATSKVRRDLAQSGVFVSLSDDDAEEAHTPHLDSEGFYGESPPSASLGVSLSWDGSGAPETGMDALGAAGGGGGGSSRSTGTHSVRGGAGGTHTPRIIKSVSLGWSEPGVDGGMPSPTRGAPPTSMDSRAASADDLFEPSAVAETAHRLPAFVVPHDESRIGSFLTRPLPVRSEAIWAPAYLWCFVQPATKHVKSARPAVWELWVERGDGEHRCVMTASRKRLCKTPYYAFRVVPSDTPAAEDVGSPRSITPAAKARLGQGSSSTITSPTDSLPTSAESNAFGKRDGNYVGKLRGNAERSRYVLYDTGANPVAVAGDVAKLRKAGSREEAHDLAATARRELLAIRIEHRCTDALTSSGMRAVTVALPAVRMRRSRRKVAEGSLVRVSRAAAWVPWTSAKQLGSALDQALSTGAQNVANAERLLVLEGGGRGRTGPERAHLADAVATAVEKLTRTGESKDGSSESKRGERPSRRSKSLPPGAEITWSAVEAVPARRGRQIGDDLNISYRTSPVDDAHLLADYVNMEVSCAVPGHRAQTLRVRATDRVARRYNLDISYPWSVFQAFAAFVARADALD